jgi:hypothetical protein
VVRSVGGERRGPPQRVSVVESAKHDDRRVSDRDTDLINMGREVGRADISTDIGE